MKCPSCGAAELVQTVRDVPYTYKGETTVIPAVRGGFCSACGELVTAADESQRVSQAMLAFNKKVNSAAVDPFFILQVRKKLELGQAEAGELFGGGVTAFSRYENGKVKPPVSLVLLFKLLDRHPELLSEVRPT
ncbi:type II toxin-antitoxin system MqsA family antitoxin [Pseudomonas chlororaphis]|uniref:type II toxin-antitoxin system MqsA family antitoxin n=1 Tax=Pseudomonas chlororaphis TaxID=587753 RepID=UPI002D783227|nr:type II toxin-antitoxin system MqsA family antitoxin [Pseudomonas chlororaphis]